MNNKEKLIYLECKINIGINLGQILDVLFYDRAFCNGFEGDWIGRV